MDNEKFQDLMLQQFNQVFEKLDSLERGQLKLETRIENEVIDKIRALFDDRDLQNTRLNRIENKVESIGIDTGYLVARVARLEKAAK